MKIIVLHWYWFLFAKLRSKIFVFLNDEKVVKLEFGNRRVPLVSILWCHMTITFVSRDVSGSSVTCYTSVGDSLSPDPDSNSSQRSESSHS